MKPNPAEALRVLEEATKDYNLDKYNLREAVVNALALLRGYELLDEVISKYRCTFCGVSGVKLWRGWGTAREAWCSKCGTAQAGLPDNIDENGRKPTQYSGNIDGKTDQIYSPSEGQCLMPWVPTPDGGTWGYTSVPPEGCLWWRQLPTKKT